jgi:hypothetical protein
MEHWKEMGARWRVVHVSILDDAAQSAADNACLCLIAMRRGRARVVEVVGPNDVVLVVNRSGFAWSWFDGAVTWGGDVLEVSI